MNIFQKLPALKKRTPFLKEMGVLSLETINAQTDGFGEKIETIVSNIKTKTEEYIQTNPSSDQSLLYLHTITNQVIRKENYDKMLAELIFERLGIKVQFNLDELTHGAVLAFPVSENHILLKDYFKGHDFFKQQTKIQNFKNKEVGTIDLANAKLGGIFSKYKHTLFISFGLDLFEDKLTPGEVTAIILHELGHAFTYYEFSDRVTAVNQVLANLAEELEKNDKKRDYSYIYNEMKDKLEIDSKDIDTILESKNPNILVGKLFTAVSDKILKESKAGKYEETASEQLADQFATRFGYGRQMVLGLDKIMQKYSPERNSKIRLFMYAVQIAMVFLLVVSIVSIIAAASLSLAAITAILNIGMIFIISISILLAGDYTRDMTYDDLLYRYKRIRLDVIQQLKNKYYTGSDAKDLIDSVKEIDAIVTDVKPFSGLFRPIMNILIPANFHAKKEIQYQQMIELLASSDLFLKAAELKALV